MKVSLLPLALSVLSVSCGHIAAYEQELRAREEAEVQRLKPAPKVAEPARTLHVRVYVDPAYRAEHPDYRADVHEMMELADYLVGPQLDTALKVDGIWPWERECDVAEVSACLDELERLDAGAPDAWVVALTGALPGLSRNLDALGHARPLGRHIFMHGMSKHDAVDDFGLDEGRELRQVEARARRKERVRHKGALVFLHAFSHTLGALHANEPDTVMHPSYNPEQAAFGADARELAITMLDASLSGASLGEQRAAYRIWLEAHPTSFIAEDRALRLAELADVAPTEAGAGRREFDVNALEAVLTVLSERDRALLADARDRAQAGATAEALASALDLAQRYPHVEPLQLFACDLGKRRREAGEPVATTCKRAQALTQNSTTSAVTP